MPALASKAARPHQSGEFSAPQRTPDRDIRPSIRRHRFGTDLKRRNRRLVHSRGYCKGLSVKSRFELVDLWLPMRPARQIAPDCGRPMVLRTARRGRSAGSQFWGCAGFPSCTGTRPRGESAAANSEIRPSIERPTRLAPPNAVEAIRTDNAGTVPRGLGSRPDKAARRFDPGVPWSDATTQRPGWIVRYDSVGGRCGQLASTVPPAENSISATWRGPSPAISQHPACIRLPVCCAT